MENGRFRIVFQKIEEESQKDREAVLLAQDVQTLKQELDEIAELRRFVEQISDPPPKSYTST